MSQAGTYGSGGGGGTVTSVTGTANQITATGTTSVVLSIPSTFIAPGSISSTTSLTAGSGFTVTAGAITLTPLASAGALQTNGSGVVSTGVLPATLGGTGQSSFTIGDLLYASTSTALSKLAAGTLNYVLTSGGPGVAPSWAASTGGVTSVQGTASQILINGATTAQTGAAVFTIPSAFVAPGSITATTSITATLGDVTVTSGNINLPGYTASVGQILFNAHRILAASPGGTNVYVGTGGNLTASGSSNLNFGSGMAALTSGTNNIGIGLALNLLTTGTGNIAIGTNSATGTTVSSYSIAIGQSSLLSFNGSTGTASSLNVALGVGALTSVVTGKWNLGLGSGATFTAGAGSALTTSDSSNVMIQHVGIVGDNNTIRLGTQGSSDAQQNKCFIAGTYNTAVGATAGVLLADSTSTGAQIGSISGTSSQVLIGGTKPAWGQVTLTTQVTGVLPEANGGTNQSTYTTGDLIYASASNTLSKLGIGSSTQVLTVTGGVPVWSPASGAGVTSLAGTTDQIVASASTGAVTLSIPSTFTSPGSVTSTTSMTSGTGITVTTGDVLLTTGKVQVTNNSVLVQNTNNASDGSPLGFKKSRSGGVITTGDTLGIINFGGFDGTATRNGAIIQSVSSGTIATNRIPADLEFLTHPDSTVAATLRMTIASTGATTIAAPDSGVGLTISGGGLTVVGTTTLSTGLSGALTAASGVVSAGTLGVANGGTGVTATTVGGILIGSSTSAFTNLAIGSNTFVLTSNGTTAAWAAASGGGMTWSVITADQTVAVNNGYICNKASALVLTLPTTSAAGDTFRVTGINTALGWKIAQAASQQIFFGNTSTTSGTGGSLQSSAIRDSIHLVCVVANLTWNVLSSQGNITVV